MTTTETHGASSIATALAGRAAFYDAVAALYYKPLTQEQVDRIAQGGLAAFAGTNELVAEGLHDMERALSKRHSGTRQELAVDFTGAFAGTSSWKGRYATPNRIQQKVRIVFFMCDYYFLLMSYRRTKKALPYGKQHFFVISLFSGPSNHCQRHSGRR